tara:strand:- start:281 stop:541 length:261 start_codon:yes stop_codon:yes gene_type:complete
MKINNSLDVARWESIPCFCGKEVIDSFPIKECLHCKFDQCWKSVPKKDFKINDFNDKGIKTGVRTIKEITLVRGDKYQDVIAWQMF